MNITRYGALVGLLVTGVWQTAEAQLEVGASGAEVCAQIDGLRKAGNLSEARAKAQQCLEGLDQEVNGAAGKYFLQEVAGWKRTKIDQNQALGFNNISASYEKDGHTATVSLTGGGSGAGGGLGGVLGGIARLGIKASGKQVKVAGLPASVQPDGNITVTLEDGSFLTFVSPDFHDADAALAGIGDLVNAFPVAEINKKLK
jgi:hypothetical protein